MATAELLRRSPGCTGAQSQPAQEHSGGVKEFPLPVQRVRKRTCGF